ncbi:WD40 repeat domain-containing protein [Oecophyllibacter saccharovorans]|nr:WD40 repeat domain-containing protein [Oecophyllibacter saccharovorans]
MPAPSMPSMPDTPSAPPSLLQHRGAERRYDSPVVATAASRDGQSLCALTADGEAVLVSCEKLRQSEEWQVVELHEGGICLATDSQPGSFLSGGEDGRVMRLQADGRSEELHKGRSWVDCVASTPDNIAFSVKKDVHLCNAAGNETLKVLPHPSALSGLAFDAKGRRLAASHYNGVSLWFVKSRDARPRLLEWKGSHIGLIIHPRDEAIVTSMQENELHGWRLPDGHNMRMSGYPRQVRSMSFTPRGRWLATSGADSAILWPFFGGGPMGKPPAELARLPGLFVTCVAAHPREEILAIGYEDGTLVLAETAGLPDDDTPRLLPLCQGARSGGVARGAISSLAFSAGGETLMFGTEEGYVGMLDLSTGAQAAPADSPSGSVPV